jgi:hypothetical protein
MRPSNKSRSRNKSGNIGNNPNNNNHNNRQRLGNIINRVFESAGPDGKVRGTPQQIIDKYQALARDAQLAGDRVAAESFLQHAEHYSRMLGEAQAAQNEARPAFERDDERRDDDGRRDEPRRDEVRRDDPRREDRGFGDQPRPRPDGDARPQPQRTPPQPHPIIASSLTTIDTDDGETGGLIETPESAGRAEPRPDEDLAAAAEAPAMNGARHPAVEPVAEAASEPAAVAADAAPKEGAKRGRPRRKAPRPEGAATEAAGS